MDGYPEIKFPASIQLLLELLGFDCGWPENIRLRFGHDMDAFESDWRQRGAAWTCKPKYLSVSILAWRNRIVPSKQGH